jgi:hypothetical protein
VKSTPEICQANTSFVLVLLQQTSGWCAFHKDLTITGTAEKNTAHQIAATAGPAPICCFNGAALLVGLRKVNVKWSRLE